MNLIKNFKKGQALPLNTIVIAILVIVVLLVIIVFFTNSLGESGDAIDGQSTSQCSLSNPALATLKYTSVQEKVEGEACSDSFEGHSSAIGIANCCVMR